VHQPGDLELAIFRSAFGEECRALQRVREEINAFVIGVIDTAREKLDQVVRGPAGGGR